MGTSLSLLQRIKDWFPTTLADRHHQQRAMRRRMFASGRARGYDEGYNDGRDEHSNECAGIDMACRRVRNDTLEEVAKAIKIFGIVPCHNCGETQKCAVDIQCSVCDGRGWEKGQTRWEHP